MTRIILIGPPGSGKSTVGPALAARLKVPFFDTDTLIEQSSSRKITDIFVEDGEDVFREIEFTILQQALEKEVGVISLGGGAPISNRAQVAVIASKSAVVFLDVSLATAAPRVGFNRDRPLLLGNPRAQWQSLSEKRRPIYEKLASESIKGDDMSVEEIVDAIELRLK
jgi:shikimate kinase